MARPALLPRLILIALLLGLGDGSALAATEDSVVRIEATVEGKTRFGSGFVVQVDGGTAYVATAAHVVEGEPNPRLFFRSRPHDARVAKVLALEGGDPNGLALLRVESNVAADLRALPRADGGWADIAAGQAVAALGIPASIRGWAVLPGAVIGWKHRSILFSGGVDEGNSGGPLVAEPAVIYGGTAGSTSSPPLAGAAVVGIVMRAAQFGEAVPALSLNIFLQNNGVTWASQTDTEQATQQPSGARGSKTAAGFIPSPKPGETFRDCETCPEMVVIPSGSFRMGSPAGEAGRSDDEGPVHAVTFDRSFAIARHEVTFDQWDACVRDGGCSHKPDDAGWGRGKRPVIYVSWDDAKEYLLWLSRRTGQTYRLPSEAEWEYAARAGTDTARFWGDDPHAACRYANVHDETSKRENDFISWAHHQCNDRYAQTAPVAQFEANAFGLNDVLGNVWEWIEDCWKDSHQGAPSDGSSWAKGDCGRRVLRGGSWYDEPDDVRSAVRYRSGTEHRGSNTGFRPARTF